MTERAAASPVDPSSLEHIRTLLAALDKPGEMLEAIFCCAPVGLQIYARDGSCVLVNPMHTQLFGSVPPPEYNVFEDTVLAERGVADLVRRAFAGERVTIPPIWYDIRELRNVMLPGPGRRFAVGAELVPLRKAEGQAVDHVLFVFHDVTAAHRAQEEYEAAAREAERARRAAESAAADAAFLAEAGRALAASLDYDTTLKRVARLTTPKIADFCVIDLIELDGTLRRVAAIHADPASQHILDELCAKYPPHPGSPQPAMRVISSGAPELLSQVDPEVVASHTVSSEHFDLMLKLHVHSHLAVPLIAGGHTLGAISLGCSGERRYRESDVPLIEALASRAALAIQNARLYREAERARAEAEAASRAKDEFLAMLGHELRNPLAPIVSALELTHEREGPSRERAIIERQVHHVRRLVDDLLDVARIARGKLEIERQPVELCLAIHDGVELASPLIQERRHQLSLRCPASGLTVFGDRVRLAQVVANLLTNAARYTEPGGAIQVEARRDGQQIELRVRDNGIGISSELLPRIYELFAQSAQAVDRGQGGLGLGLAIVKSLVELHGGKVEAHSQGTGQGSQFVVRLPALAGAPSSPPPAEVTLAPARSAARVLLVDDNADAADLLAEALKLRGYLVAVAYNAYDALELLSDNTFDAALLDIGLPGMDGLELCRRIRALPQHASLRMVALTGYGQPGDRSRSQAAGFDLHLVKPVDARQLQAALQTLLSTP